MERRKEKVSIVTCGLVLLYVPWAVTGWHLKDSRRLCLALQNSWGTTLCQEGAGCIQMGWVDVIESQAGTEFPQMFDLGAPG